MDISAAGAFCAALQLLLPEKPRKAAINMSDVRQRRKPTAANGLPAGLASSADGAKATNADGAVSAPSPDELLTPKKLQRIDCTKGHVGITCSNHLDPPGD